MIWLLLCLNNIQDLRLTYKSFNDEPVGISFNLVKRILKGHRLTADDLLLSTFLIGPLLLTNNTSSL